MARYLLNLTIVLFGALTLAALWKHGYWGLLAPGFQSLAGAQVLVDLIISLTLVMLVMQKDARDLERPFWGWCVATLVLGSFGPLLYLWTRPNVTRSSG